MSKREERVERSDGKERRWRGRRVVGRTLGISGITGDYADLGKGGWGDLHDEPNGFKGVTGVSWENDR